MGDFEAVLAYSFGLVGVIAAAMLVYVYRTVSVFEVRWRELREKTQATMQAFKATESNISSFKEKLDAKASYEQTEKHLAEATSKLFLNDKQKALAQLNDNISVQVN